MKAHEYERTLRDMMELQMGYALHVARTAGSSLASCAGELTEAYAHSVCFRPDVPAAANADWQAVARALERLWREAGAAAFPARAWQMLAPVLTPGIGSALENERRYFERAFAGFDVEYRGVYFGPAEPAVLTLHFRNAFTPDSPFQHEREIVCALRDLCARARSERPDVVRVQCATWLNNVDSFCCLFPDAWRSGAAICPYEPHSGWWGQFIDRTGRIHRPRAERFRAGYHFPFANVQAQCGLDEWEQHLARLAALTALDPKCQYQPGKLV